MFFELREPGLIGVHIDIFVNSLYSEKNNNIFRQRRKRMGLSM